MRIKRKKKRERFIIVNKEKIENHVKDEHIFKNCINLFNSYLKIKRK